MEAAGVDRPQQFVVLIKQLTSTILRKFSKMLTKWYVATQTAFSLELPIFVYS